MWKCQELGEGTSGYSSLCACVTCWCWWWWCFPAPIPLLLIPRWLWKYLFACFMDEGMMCCCCVPGYKPPLANVMKTVFNSRWFLNGARVVAACSRGVRTIENKFPIFSDLPAEDPRSVQPNNLLRLFLAMLRAVLQTGGFLARTPPADKMVN